MDEKDEKRNLLSAQVAARRLGISRPTLSRLKEDIGYYRLGSRTLFDAEALEEFKRRQFRKKPAEA